MKKLLTLALLISTQALAANSFPGVSFSEARVLAPVKGSTVTAAYVNIKNDSDQKVTIQLVAIKPFKAVELHETYEADGKTGMRKIEKIEIAPHQNFELSPGGNHMMLFDAKSELKAGKKLNAQFLINGKKIDVEFLVETRATHPDVHSHGAH